jgi:hypothetical protein
MASYRNVSPYGDLELTVRSPAGVEDRSIYVVHGGIVHVDGATEVGIAAQPSNWELLVEVETDAAVVQPIEGA